MIRARIRKQFAPGAESAGFSLEIDLEAGKVVPVIDRRYPLSDAAEALRYLAQGHAQGKVVLTVPPCTAT